MPDRADVEALVSYVVSSVVEHPDAVSIQARAQDSRTVYEITVHPDDMGKVIGRQGRVIKALRVLVRAAASLNGSDATVEVIG